MTDTRPGRIRPRSRALARSPRQINLARELRRAETEAERLAWQLLRKLRAEGYVFRRQHPVGTYVVDFCCPQKRLIVELDGSVHAQPCRVARDTRRDAYLRRLGYAIASLPNGIVLEAPDEFVRRVRDRVRLLPSVFTGDL